MKLSYIRSYKIRRGRSIGLIGCGNFAFSTISFFISKNQGKVFGSCYDINKENSDFFSKFYGYKQTQTLDALLNDDMTEVVYIASNHATHADYAIQVIKSNKIPYIEKPITVTYEQLVELRKIKDQYNATIYTGYNRPFSKAINIIKSQLDKTVLHPFTVNFTVCGHKIEAGHWYRDAKEGTRILANLAHWIDLSIHLLRQRAVMPNLINISIVYSNTDTPSDNIALTFTTDLNDLFVFTFTSRSEPLEGVNETILLQNGSLTAKIDDFREMQLWNATKFKKIKFFPKDAGHEKAVLQPFQRTVDRKWEEIELSALLILYIENIVNQKLTFSIFDIDKEVALFLNAIK
jgi:predicted dehydrogenase